MILDCAEIIVSIPLPWPTTCGFWSLRLGNSLGSTLLPYSDW